MSFPDLVKQAQHRLESLITGNDNGMGNNIVTLADLYAVMELQLRQLRNLQPARIDLPDAYKVRYVKLFASSGYVDREFLYGGSYLYVLESRTQDGFLAYNNSSSAPRLSNQNVYSIKFDNVNNDPIELYPGMLLRLKHFDKFYINLNYTNSNVDLILMISDVDIMDITQPSPMPFVYSDGSGINLQRPALIDINGHQQIDVLTLPALTAGTNNIGIVVLDRDNQTFVKKTYDWTGAVTAQAVWTPSSGKKFVLTDMYVSVTADLTLTIFDNTDDTTNRIMKLSLKASSGFIDNRSKPFMSLAANNVLKITTSATGGYITVCGYEV